MKAAVKPCSGCPWRIDSDAADIPNFDLERAERLARTCPDERGVGPEFGAPMFACHESKEGHEFACAGWLAVCGSAHPLVRLAVIRGNLDPARLTPAAQWPPLHPTHKAMMVKLRSGWTE